ARPAGPTERLCSWPRLALQPSASGTFTPRVGRASDGGVVGPGCAGSSAGRRHATAAAAASDTAIQASRRFRRDLLLGVRGERRRRRRGAGALADRLHLAAPLEDDALVHRER